MTKEYDDLIKKWSRINLYQFIIDSYPNIKKRKELRVVFFPAVEAYDFYEIFNRARIRPGNCIGLEIDKKEFIKIT